MSGFYPSPNDREFNLLNKITKNTAAIADLEAGDVASITGTANQITVSQPTGAVTLSLPTSITSINSITSAAASNLTLATGTFGTALTLSSASGAATFAGTIAAKNLSTISDSVDASSIVNETYSQNLLVVTKYTYPGFTAKGIVGMLSVEMQLGFNINYDGRVHNLYDETKPAWYWTLNDGGTYLQFIPAGANAPTTPNDIWVRTGSYPIAILNSKNTLLGASRSYVDSGFRLSVESAGTAGAARFLNGYVLVDKAATAGTASTTVDTGAALQVVASAADAAIIQSWNYISASAYNLKLRQIVSAGLVKYTFDQSNNGTDYTNVLTFHNGSVAVGAATAVQTLTVGGSFGTQSTYAGSSYTDAGNVFAGSVGIAKKLWTNADATIGGNLTVTGPIFESTDTLTGSGAISVTKSVTKYTTAGVGDALTLANGTDGQIKRIVLDVLAAGGHTAILTPTTKTGFSTVTFGAAGQTVSLQYFTTRGWMVIGSYGAVVA